MPSDGAPPADARAHLQVSNLMDGYLATQLLYVAAEVGARRRARRRAPRGRDGGRRPSAPSPMRSCIACCAGWPPRACSTNPPTAASASPRSGLACAATCRARCAARSSPGATSTTARAPACSTRCGTAAWRSSASTASGFFESLAQHPDRRPLRSRPPWWTDRGRRLPTSSPPTISAPCARLVDVGGGHGVLLEAILAAAPRCRACSSIGRRSSRAPGNGWRRTGLAGRCEFVAGDFFAAMPPGGDAYLLSRVIHDWDDERAVRILANCRRAMATGRHAAAGRGDPAGARHRTAVGDPHGRAHAHARGRTRTDYGTEYERLLGAAGFRLVRVVPTRSPAGVSVIEAVPAALQDSRDASGP